MQVRITPEALTEYNDLPRGMQPRMMAVVRRLENWPGVSGAKPLRGALAGNWRIRTGDYRIIFREERVSKTKPPTCWSGRSAIEGTFTTIDAKALKPGQAGRNRYGT
jgi:mRNA-degrading endonuclease RelE of RelBE toxin-antitoxin system